MRKGARMQICGGCEPRLSILYEALEGCRVVENRNFWLTNLFPHGRRQNVDGVASFLQRPESPPPFFFRFFFLPCTFFFELRDTPPKYIDGKETRFKEKKSTFIGFTGKGIGPWSLSSSREESVFRFFVFCCASFLVFNSRFSLATFSFFHEGVGVPKM